MVGAIPVALAVALVTGKPSFAIRKEAKGHGVGGRIAGVLEPGQRVVVVEDTATSGGSLLEALPAVTELDCPIVAVSLLLDRGGELGAKLAPRASPTARCSARPTSGTTSAAERHHRPGTVPVQPAREMPAFFSTSAGTPTSRQVE